MPQPSRQKEAALLLLPILAFATFGILWQRQVARRNQQTSGPYRAQITRMEPRPLTALDVAAGFDTKLELFADEWGSRPNSKDAATLESDLQLVGHNNGHEVRYQTNLSPAGFDRGWRSRIPLLVYAPTGKTDSQEHGLMVLANTATFPLESPVSLEGSVHWKLYNPGDQEVVESRIGQVSYPLRARNQYLAIPTFPPSPLSMEKITARYFPPVFQHFSPRENRYDASLIFIAKAPECPVKNESCFSWLDTRFQGQSKRAIENVAPPSGCVAAVPGEKAFERLVRYSEFSFPGEARYQGSLSYDNATPVPFTVVARPNWFTQKPKHLQIDSITVKGNEVLIGVRYLKIQALQFKTTDGDFYENLRSYDDLNPKHEWWDDTQNDYLLTSWSQHLSVGGKEYWGHNVAWVKDVMPQGYGRYRVIYATNASKIVKLGRQGIFHAQIGLKGEGFLPVEVPLTK